MALLATSWQIAPPRCTLSGATTGHSSAKRSARVWWPAWVRRSAEAAFAAFVAKAGSITGSAAAHRSGTNTALCQAACVVAAAGSEGCVPPPPSWYMCHLGACEPGPLCFVCATSRLDAHAYWVQLGGVLVAMPRRHIRGGEVGPRSRMVYLCGLPSRWGGH